MTPCPIFAYLFPAHMCKMTLYCYRDIFCLPSFGRKGQTWNRTGLDIRPILGIAGRHPFKGESRNAWQESGRGAYLVVVTKSKAWQQAYFAMLCCCWCPGCFPPPFVGGGRGGSMLLSSAFKSTREMLVVARGCGEDPRNTSGDACQAFCPSLQNVCLSSQMAS